MDWKEAGKKLAEIGLPLLGAALPVPGGAALGTLLGSLIGGKTPEEVAVKIATNAEAFEKAQAFQSQHEEKILAMLIDAEKAERAADSMDLATVNATMVAEINNSANEAWYQKAWRPANGFCVAAGSFVGVVATCLLFYQAIIAKDVTALNAMPQLATALALILGVPGAAVGIASWHRGKEKRTAAEMLGK
jgi:roadblock/LC7 domain-containing protein